MREGDLIPEEICQPADMYVEEDWQKDQDGHWCCYCVGITGYPYEVMRVRCLNGDLGYTPWRNGVPYPMPAGVMPDFTLVAAIRRILPPLPDLKEMRKRGDNVIAYYAGQQGDPDNLTGLLSDLMQWAADHSRDFEESLCIARSNFEAQNDV